jgi:hypothetical protein
VAKKKFEKALETIGDAVVDFSQLNVRTFVGAVKISSQTTGDPKWDELMKKAISSGKVMLAASTTVHIDGDCDHFEDPDQITPGLRESHDNAVKAGHAARQAIIEMIKDRVQKLIT